LTEGKSRPSKKLKEKEPVSRSGALPGEADSLSIANGADAVQYRDWLDSLYSRVSRCLEQLSLFKRVDEAVALLIEAQIQSVLIKDTELVT
jgi:hypothetical protein